MIACLGSSISCTLDDGNSSAVARLQPFLRTSTSTPSSGAESQTDSPFSSLLGIGQTSNRGKPRPRTAGYKLDQDATANSASGIARPSASTTRIFNVPPAESFSSSGGVLVDKV